MAKFQYIDNAGKKQMVQATSSDEAIRIAPNIASNSGVMAVDTLSRPADKNVDRGVEVVNDFQSRGVSPTLESGVSRSLSTTPPEVPEQSRGSIRDVADDLALELAGATQESVALRNQRVKEEAGLVEAAKLKNQLFNNITARQREMQKQLERLEKNPQGKGDFALDADIARFNRESARELADLSFSYQVALGDYELAEKIANDYIADLNADFERKTSVWNILMKASEMTDEEKMLATQAFQEKQMQDQFELNKKLAQFNQTLSQNDPLYQANLRAKLAEAESAEKQREMLENAIQNGEIILTKEQQDTAFKLQDDYERESDEFIKQADAYDRIIASAQDPSAAGDLALIFNYMKVLDPGSTVREGEFANAENSAGVPARIRAQYNKAISGERLPTEQRNDFVNRATMLYDSAAKSQDKRVEQFSTRASQFGVPAEVVARDVYSENRDSAEELLKNTLISEEEKGFLSGLFGQYKTTQGFSPDNFFNQQ